MTTLAEIATKVRVALGVSADYETAIIPNGIRRQMKRLLRDYNFPKSIKRYESPVVTAAQTTYEAPAGLKRPLELRFRAADNTYTKPIERREGFTLPQTQPIDEDLYGRHYWLEGTDIVIDTPMPAAGVPAGLKLIFWYQSQLLDTPTEAWMIDDMEDIIFSASTMRLAAENRKPEVMQLFAPLVQDEMTSIAIYANELEWAGMNMMMREPRGLPTSRYPAQAYS